MKHANKDFLTLHSDTVWRIKYCAQPHGDAIWHKLPPAVITTQPHVVATQHQIFLLHFGNKMFTPIVLIHLLVG